MTKKYIKTIPGFVSQTFELKEVSNPTDKGTHEVFVCTGQEFIPIIGERTARTAEIDTAKEIDQKTEMRATDYDDFIDDRWHISDVQGRYKSEDDEDDNDKEPLSDEVARKILHLCMDKMDANVGINWDMIDYWTDEVLSGRS